MISYIRDKKQLTIQIYDARNRSSLISYIENPMMIYTFDDRLKIVSIGSSDLWDILAREYFEEGILSYEPGIEYLTAFKDSLLWWDGEQFVNEPTLASVYPTQKAQ